MADTETISGLIDRVSNLENNLSSTNSVVSQVAGQIPPAPTTSTATTSTLTGKTTTSTAIPGYVWLNPIVNVVSGGTPGTSWVTVSGTVPSGALAVILQAIYNNNGGSGVRDCRLTYRTNSSDPRTLIICASADPGNNDGSNQVTFPVNSDGSFQYSMNYPDMVLSLWIIGYITSTV